MKKTPALLALLWPVLGQAQDVQQAAAAANPDAPAAALSYQALPALGASALVRELDDWRQANATVGQFPRGHADIVKWERTRPEAAEPPRSPEPTR